MDGAARGRGDVSELRAQVDVALWTWLPIATAVGVLVQREIFTDPGADTVYFLMLLAPTAARALGHRWPPLRRVPVLVWSVLTAGGVLGLVARPEELDLAPFFLVLAAAAAAVDGNRFTALTTLALCVGVMVGVDVADRFDGAFVWVLGIVLGSGWGSAIRTTTDLVAELQEAQAGLAARAAADERQRIAREVHDVVAHSLAVTMLHVTGARMAVRRDPAEAYEALEQAEQLGRQSLAEVRRIVGLLQPGGNGTATALPGAADVPALVEQFRGAGLTVDLRVEGDLGRVAPTSGLAIYRIAQESLTNVAKHAPGSAADLRIDVRDGTVKLEVTNAAPASSTTPEPAGRGSGLGVPGMRARAESLGGEFRAGAPAGGGCWHVEAALPVGAE
jgi:signal transduction histidine kinase